MNDTVKIRRLLSLATQDYGNVKRSMGTAHECDKLISFPYSQRPRGHSCPGIGDWTR
jgi:hypothetical protein